KEYADSLLYSDIVVDTGRFLLPNTSVKTFQSVADLITYAFDRSEIYTNLYRMKENVARLQGYILLNYTLHPSGMSSIMLTKDLLDKYDLTSVVMGQLVNVFSDVSGIKALFEFIVDMLSIIMSDSS